MSQEIKIAFRDKFLKPNSYARISELEWLLIAEDLKKEYIDHCIVNLIILPDFILKAIEEPLKSQYISSMIKVGYYPGDLGLKVKDLSEELYKCHIDKIIGETSIEDEVFELLTEEQKRKHINKSSERGYSITEHQFNYLKPLEKLDFIIYNGTHGNFMLDWYKSWRDATEREKRMDSILN